jgi:hypothetical protein
MPSKDIGFDREPEAPPKQARSTKYQLTIANVRFAKVKSPKELGDFCPRSHHAHGLPRKMVANLRGSPGPGLGRPGDLLLTRRICRAAPNANTRAKPCRAPNTKGGQVAHP